MSGELRAISSSETIKFGNGTKLSMRGAKGQATHWVHRRGAFRLPAEEDTDPRLDAAFEAVGIVPQETIHLAAQATRSAEQDEVVLQPAPVKGKMKTVQIVMYADEAGGVSWHFPDGFFDKRPVATPADKPVFRSAQKPVFTIPTRTAAAQSAGPPRLRGMVTKIGRKVFKVLVIPIASAILKNPVKWLGDKIESRYKQDLIRAVTPDNYQQRVSTPFRSWNKLRGKRSLLIIHGIFSSTEGVLSLLPRAQMLDLYQRYDGRVISYDHLTVTKDPEQNARFFLEQLAAQRGRFSFDILTHSRGGIVTRTLTERGHELANGHNCEFPNAYMVAVPNQGSPLGDPDHMLDMVDTFTNVLTSFPDGWLTYSIEVVLGVIKLIGYTGQIALPGIASMGTKGYIPDVLNANREACETAYAAAASNYHPDPRGQNGFARGHFVNAVMDRVFTREGQRIKNDLVVPCDEVYTRNGHSSFPVRNPLVFRKDRHVWHNGFFLQDELLDDIRSHFGIADRGSQGQGGAASPPSDAGPASPKSSRKIGLRKFRKTGRVPQSGADDTSLQPTRRSKKASRVKKTPTSRGPRRSTAATESAAPSTTVYRDPQIDFHERVRVGKKENLTVRLNDVDAAEFLPDEMMELLIKEGEEQITLTVIPNAPGFEIDRHSEDLVIKRQRNPRTEMTRFQLTALDCGPEPVTREICMDFWHGNQCVGAATHQTVVVPRGYRGPVDGHGGGQVHPLKITDEMRTSPDLVVYVHSINTSGQPPFLVQMRSTLPERPYEAKTVGTLDIQGDDLAEYLNSIYSDQFDNFPQEEFYETKQEYQAAFEQWQQDLMEHLRAVGEELWDLLPKQFHHEYFALMELKQRPRSVLVHSDEMILPWELMIPHRNEGKATNLPPLGCIHVLGRWKPGLTTKPVPQQLAVENFCAINPKYDGDNALPWSQDELKKLAKLLPHIVKVSPADKKTLRKKVLDRDDIQLVHFSGHGDYTPNNANLNHLILAGGDKLTALVMGRSKCVKEGNPVVYMNACSVGRGGMAIGRMGGFSARLLSNGCSGVIAPYWPVVDRPAMEFALALYQQLKTGTSIGEALRELRAAHQDDPTYQAFSYFGDPWARLEFA